MNITPVIHSVELLLLPRIEIETLLEGCFSVHYWVMKQLISVFVAKSRATWLHCFAEVGVVCFALCFGRFPFSYKVFDACLLGWGRKVVS